MAFFCRGLFALATLLMVAVIACSGKTKSVPPSEPPEAVVRQVLAAVNNNDVDSAYGRLSTEAQKTLTRGGAASLFFCSTVAGFQASLESIDDQTINGDRAEIELSI